MTAIPFPAQLPNTQEWGLRSNTQTSASPLTGSTQTIELPGAAWTVQLSFKTLTPSQMRIMAAFMVRMRGQAGRFTLHNHAYDAPLGVASGSPKVSGAGQTGTSLVTAGWTPNTPGILLAGDYIGVGGKLKMVVEDASSDAGGNAALLIEPPIYPGQAPADLTVIVVDKPTCTMMLDANTVKWSTQPPRLSSFTIGAVEDVLS